MIGAILGSTIPVFYILMGAFAYFFAFVTISRHEAWLKEQKKWDHSSSWTDAPMVAGFAAVFWPVVLPGVIAWKYGVRATGGSPMSRKQRAQIAYLREKAELDAKALETQQKWEQLLAKENLR